MTLKTSVEELIARSIDAELSAEEQDRLEAHLATHPEHRSLHDALRRQSALIDKAVPVPSAARLRSLRGQVHSTPSPVWNIAASIAIFAVGLGVGYAVSLRNGEVGTDLAVFAEQATAAHALYVGEVLHPVEVAAHEKDHLQTWLSNRLGATIIAPQLGKTGYTLIGGRLLPAGDHASALFMYENRDGDRLSLMATHGATTQRQSFRYHEEDSFLTVYWQDGPWQYSLVGDQARDPMGQIAREIQEQLI